jgi:protoporphyrinogen oxidase
MSEKKNHSTVCIVGAGLSGLSCAKKLQATDIDFMMIEACAFVGGKVKTHSKEGFLLDEGFQVLLPSYPMVKALLDIKALKLTPFPAGALIKHADGSWREFHDPIRHPSKLLTTLLNSPFTLSDLLKLAQLRFGPIKPDAHQSTLSFLTQVGFSHNAIESFFKPFFSGVFLEKELETPANFFTFLFQQFSESKACLPQNGMQAIAQQLAGSIPSDKIKMNTTVKELRYDDTKQQWQITSDNHLVFTADYLVWAAPLKDFKAVTEKPISLPEINYRSVWVFYYRCAELPLKTKALVLTPHCKVINHISFPSAVQAGYSNNKEHLVSISVLGYTQDASETLRGLVEKDLQQLFRQAQINSWQFIEAFNVEHALPQQTVDPNENETLSHHLIFAGDRTQIPSINGALASGVAAANLYTQRSQEA